MKRGLVAAASIATVIAMVGLLLAWSKLGDARGGGELTLYGNIDVRELDLAFRVPGRIDHVGPEEGDRVRVGQILARLDARPFKDAYGAANGQLAIAEAGLAKARAGSRREEIGQAEARLRQAYVQRDLAKQALDRRTGLVAVGAISQRDFEETDARYRSSSAEVDVAAQAVTLLRSGTRTEDRRAAAAQVAASRAQRDGTATSLDDTALRTPVAGTIVTRAREPGAIVRPGETVLTLAITDPVRVRAYVSGADLSRVAPGMRVWITTDGNPRRYAGRIGQIAAKAEFTPKTVQTPDLRTDLVYRVHAIVEGPDDTLRQGQPVTIVVPSHASGDRGR